MAIDKGVLSFFLLGLSLGSGPCLASCGPLLIFYISSTGKNISRAMATYLLFSLSRVSVYCLLGLGVFLFGRWIAQVFTGYLWRYIYIFGGIFMVFIGLLIAVGRNTDYKLCQRLRAIFLEKDKKTVFLFGAFIGLAPCLSLISALSYIGLISRAWPESLFYSLAFGLGTTISPLLILLVFLSGAIPQIFIRDNKFLKIFNLLCGLAIIFLGLKLILRFF